LHWIELHSIRYKSKFCRTFFQNMYKPASGLHHLLPPPRNTSAISGLLSSTPLPRPTSRTKKFEWFLNFALNKYQSPLWFSLTAVALLFLLRTIVIVCCYSTLSLLYFYNVFSYSAIQLQVCNKLSVQCLWYNKVCMTHVQDSYISFWYRFQVPDPWACIIPITIPITIIKVCYKLNVAVWDTHYGLANANWDKCRCLGMHIRAWPVLIGVNVAVVYYASVCLGMHVRAWTLG